MRICVRYHLKSALFKFSFDSCYNYLYRLKQIILIKCPKKMENFLMDIVK